MTSRARPRIRAIAVARPRPIASWISWGALAAALLAAAAAQAQTTQGGATDGRTAPPSISQPNDAPPGMPGGVAERGVITPPAAVDPAMPIARPNADAFPTPTIRPPGTPGADAKVIPK
jgi:hypothetical protein